MQELYERLFVGSEWHCRSGDSEWAVVHACKSPCHQRAVGYQGSLRSNHPNYLVLEEENNLYLNIVDPPQPLFMPPLFTAFLSFAKKEWEKTKKVLIHCNQGESRAPSLALLFLAKYAKAIAGDSYEMAKSNFVSIFPSYRPGQGIQIYLSKHWDEFNDF